MIKLDGDPTIVVSMVDLIQHPLYEEIKKEYEESEDGQEKFLIKMLLAMGLDTKKNYESSFCIHTAPLSGEMVTCERFYGLERTDRNWVDFKEAQEQYFINKELDLRFNGRFKR